MNNTQIRAAYQLLLMLQSDPEAAADCATYGNWLEHLADHLSDIAIDGRPHLP